MTTLEEWKYASMELGVRFAITCGKTKMQVFSASNLDFLLMVWKVVVIND